MRRDTIEAFWDVSDIRQGGQKERHGSLTRGHCARGSFCCYPSPMSPDEPKTRPLPALRAMIDAVDRDILQLLSQRMALVAEVARYKRETGTPIRDLAREKRVLEDRRRRALSLGLPPDTVDSLYRLLLVSSRARQSELRAEVPVDAPRKTVAILGAKGGMGQHLVHFFSSLGHAVLEVDLDTEITGIEAAAIADVVVLSVPIRETERIIEEVGPHLREDALLMDITSVKQGPLETMLRSTKASVVGTHPMYGPAVSSLTGQRVVVVPGRGEEWQAWVEQAFRARGARITHASAEEHDRAMGVVQVLTHFHTELLGLALSKLGLPIERSLEFTSPSYLLELYVLGRHFAQSPALYGAIEMSNPERERVVQALQESLEELGGAVVDRNQRGFEEVFTKVRAFLGDAFTQEALHQSRFLVDRLVELSTGRGERAK